MLIETARDFFSYATTLNQDPTSSINTMLFDSYRMLETNPKVINHLTRFYGDVTVPVQSHA